MGNYDVTCACLVAVMVDQPAARADGRAVIAPESRATGETPEEVLVVTGTRTSAFDSPYSATRISREQIAKKLVRNLPEALTATPGVMVQKTAHGQGSPFLRGFTGYRTLTLIDGVRYNNSIYRDGPNEYFSLIDFNSVEQIELLNGPAGVLYGSDAIGGTLNLQTKSSRFADAQRRFFRGSQDYRYSTADDSHLARTEFDFGAGQRWGAHVGYSQKHYGDLRAADLGTQPQTGYGERAFDLRYDQALNAQWDLTLVHQALTQDDVWRTHATIYGRSFAGTSVGSDLVRQKDQSRSLSYFRLSGTEIAPVVDAIELTLSSQAWDEDGERVRSNRRQLLESFESRMLGVDLALETHFQQVSVSYGIDYYRDTVDSRGVEFAPDGRLREIKIQGPVGDDAHYGMLGVHLQAEFDPLNRLAVTIGSRYTNTHVDIGRYEDPTSGLPAAYADRWTGIVNSARATYDVARDHNIKLWAGVSQSFRAPNIADLSRFGASRTNETEIAATNLEPENFLTYEIGLKAHGEPWRASGTYYYTRIHDFITSTPTGRTVEELIEVSKTNSASGFVHGVELAVEYSLSRSVSAFANLTWLEGRLDVFENSATLVRVREPLSRIMPLTANLGLEWSSADARSWLALAVTIAGAADHLSAGDRNDTERIPPGGTPGYSYLALRAGHRLTARLAFDLALENVLDEAYRTHGSGSNEPGFGAKLGLRVSF